LVGDGRCCCSAVVLVELVLLLAEASAWLTIGCCCCSAVVLVALVLLLAESIGFTARDSSENRVTDTCMQGYAGGRFGQEVDEQRRGSQESTASRTPAVKGRWSFRPNSRRFWRMATRVVARHGSLQCKSLQALVTPFWSLSACSARARRHSVQTDWGLVALMSNLRLKSPKRVA